MTDINDVEFWKKLYYYVKQNRKNLPQYIINDIQNIDGIKSQLIRNEKLTKIQVMRAQRIIDNFDKFGITLDFSTKTVVIYEPNDRDKEITVGKKDVIPCPPHDYQVVSSNPKQVIRRCIKCSDQSTEKIY